MAVLGEIWIFFARGNSCQILGFNVLRLPACQRSKRVEGEMR
jgi:hypothetical protein